MMSYDDIESHITDYLTVLSQVEAHPGITPNREHEVALVIMLVHGMHRSTELICAHRTHRS